MKLQILTTLTLLTAVLAAPVASGDSSVATTKETPTSSTYSAILSIVAKQSSKFSKHQKRADIDDNISNRYIVTFDEDASLDQIAEVIEKLDSLVDHESSSSGITAALDLNSYTDGSGFFGFIGKFSPEIVDKLKESSIVQIEQDETVDQNIDIDEPAPPSHEKRDMETVDHPKNWGLGRISNKQFQKDNNWTYTRETVAKHPTVAYVVDSGVRTTHEMFEGRAFWGANFVQDEDYDKQVDSKGHGTHVAGTVGGKDYGVDENTKIVSVKVFRKGGSYASEIIAGFTWAVNDYIKNKESLPRGVLNFSGFTSNSTAAATILTRGVKEGLVIAVSAGNDSKDACGQSPAVIGAKTPGIITVASLNEKEEPSWFTNVGKCVDVWGPGSQILSADYLSDTGIVSKSGTSMSTPHVAGLATYYLSISDKLLTPAEVEDLITKSNTGVLTFDLKGTPNAVAYNGNGK